MINDEYKHLKSIFFGKENLKEYVRQYREQVNLLVTKKKLWRYVLSNAWKKDETLFINKQDNDLFYSLKMKDIRDRVLVINPNFSIDIYIMFNIDLIDICNYTYHYFNHYLQFGKDENRICCIESSKSCNINTLTNNCLLMKHVGNSIYDYIEYFIRNATHDIKWNDVLYDNTYTTENSHDSATKLIQAMKQLQIDKKTSYHTPYNPTDAHNINILDRLELNYSKVSNTNLLIDDVENSSISLQYNLYDDTTIYSKFPFIYHKYKLNLVKLEGNVIYKLIYSVDDLCNRSFKIVAHLHCLDINQFDQMYGKFITIIQQHIPIIIVTYSFGTPSIRYNNCIILKIQNKGMDIGGKIIAVNHLNRLKIKYDYMLFLHSKSDSNKRAQYFNPFFDNLSFILESIERNEYDGYFPPMILNGDYYHLVLNDQFAGNTQFPSARHVRNKTMFDEFCDLLNLDKNIALFSEGNNFILSHATANYLYKLEFYNILNYKNSFDAHWVMVYYSLFHLNTENIYNEYVNRKLHGNNFETNLGYQGLADSQIEHVFERLVFNVIHKNNGRICILPYSNEVSHRTKFIENQINYSYMESPSTITSNELLLANNINLIEQNATLVIIACHTNSELKIQCLIRNIMMFIRMSKKIIICNSDDFSNTNIEKKIYSVFSNNKNMIDFHYVKNDCFVCHSKWNHTINKYYSTLIHYKHFILTNDSYLFIKEPCVLSNFMDFNYEMQSILISNESRHHYTDFLRVYNYSGLIKINNLYKSFINKNKTDPSLTQYNIITNLEMKSHELFTNKNGLFEEKRPINIHFIEPYKKIYIEKLNYPIIKIKSMMTTVYDNIDLPCDFEPNVYTSLHNDLLHLTNTAQIKHHFKTSGIKEGRIYKRGQVVTLPPYIQTQLSKLNITV